MESERDDICSWCNASLKDPAGPPKADAAAPAAAPAKAEARAAKRAEPVAAPKRAGWVWPVVAVLFVVAALAYPLVISGKRASAPPPAPGEWKAFTSKDQSFTASYPAGWGLPSNSGSPGSFVLVEWKGGRLCKVQVKGSQTAGAVGDVAAAKERAAGGEGCPVPLEKTANGALFDFFNAGGQFAKARPGYEEGAMQEAHGFAGVKSAAAEYSYTRRIGLVSIKMKGMRAASFQGDYGYHAWAEAPAVHWDAFRPTAEQILASVALGRKS